MGVSIDSVVLQSYGVHKNELNSVESVTNSLAGV